jgi:hypothetical protein
MIITPVANCSTGFAASCVLLSSEVTVVDAAKDAMALFFINRLDEDFGKLHTMVGVLWRRIGRIDPIDRDMDDSDAADELLSKFGPFTNDSRSYLFWTFLFITEFILFLSAFITPFVYFACAM